MERKGLSTAARMVAKPGAGHNTSRRALHDCGPIQWFIGKASRLVRGLASDFKSAAIWPDGTFLWHLPVGGRAVGDA